MTPSRFRQLAEMHGGALGRWPEGERAAARGLLAESPEARAVLDDVARVDAALASVRGGEPEPIAVDRVLRMIEQRLDDQVASAAAAHVGVAPVIATLWTTGTVRDWTPWAASMGAMVVLGVLGFVVGGSGLVPWSVGSPLSVAALTTSSPLTLWMP